MNYQTNNPFDFSRFFLNYDPQAFFKQLQSGFSAYQLPNVDTRAVIEAQKKNVDALVAANKAAIAGTQELLRQQGEMLQQAMADATEAARSLSGMTSPQDLAKKQMDLVQAAFEKALSNSTELSELVRKNQDEVAKLMTQRVTESLQEIKEAIHKAG